MLKIAMTLVVLNMDDMGAATARYLGSGPTGRHMDMGFAWIGLGIALGVLSEISFGLRGGFSRKDRKDAE